MGADDISLLAKSQAERQSDPLPRTTRSIVGDPKQDSVPEQKPHHASHNEEPDPQSSTPAEQPRPDAMPDDRNIFSGNTMIHPGAICRTKVLTEAERGNPRLTLAPTPSMVFRLEGRASDHGGAT